MSLGDYCPQLTLLSLNTHAASLSAYLQYCVVKQQLKRTQDEIPPCSSASTLIYWRGMLFLQLWQSVVDCKAIAKVMVYVLYNSQHFFHIHGIFLWNHVQYD